MYVYLIFIYTIRKHVDRWMYRAHLHNVRRMDNSDSSFSCSSVCNLGIAVVIGSSCVIERNMVAFGIV